MLHPIRRVRLEQGRRQYQLAAESGLHPTTLCLIECGRVEPTPDQLRRIARVLKTPVTSLINKADD